MSVSFFFGNIKSEFFVGHDSPDLIAFGNLSNSSLIDGEKTKNHGDPLGAFREIIRLGQAQQLQLGIALSYEFSELFSPIGLPIIKRYDIPLYTIYGYKNFDKNLTSACPNYKEANKNIDISEYSNFSRKKYYETIKLVQDEISLGNTYQVNLSQSFKIPIKCNSFDFFNLLIKNHPSPYSAYMDLNHTGIPSGAIFSNSPELFLKKTANKIITKPIKGTRPRDKNPLIDAKLRSDLILSEKDIAELSMIVDLERNDLSEICNDNTVIVESHADVVESTNVFHLESTVSGVIKDEVDFFSIIKQTFPSGSISGAPKLSTRKIIKNLEQEQRGIYTGSIGVILPNGDFTLSVAIRSGFIDNNHIYFNSGGGITLSSSYEEEYEETLHKASAIKETLSIFSVLWYKTHQSFI